MTDREVSRKITAYADDRYNDLLVLKRRLDRELARQASEDNRWARLMRRRAANGEIRSQDAQRELVGLRQRMDRRFDQVEAQLNAARAQQVKKVREYAQGLGRSTPGASLARFDRVKLERPTITAAETSRASMGAF